jgi:diguanylate cyclase (GGDEF)-like protein
LRVELRALRSTKYEVAAVKEHSAVGEGSRQESGRALIRQAANLLATDLSLADLFERLTTMLPQYLESSVVFIALAHPDGEHRIEYFYDHGQIKPFPHIPLGPESRARAVIASGEPIWGNDPSEWAPGGSRAIYPDQPWTNDTVSAMFVPMRAGGATLGCLSVQSVRGGAYTPEDVDVIAAIGHYLGVAVQNQRMYQALARTAEYDPMTGIANASKLARRFEEALSTSTSLHATVAVMFDIVNFAAFNACYGYDEGDGVLRRIAAMLREFEDEDEDATAGRFGGDVFMVIRRGIAPDAIGGYVEALATRLHDIAYVGRDATVPVSLACGYAVAPLDGNARRELMARCVDRVQLSRRQNCRPVRIDELDDVVLHGNFSGIAPIVEAALGYDPYTRIHLLQVNEMAKQWSEFNLELDGRAMALMLQSSLLHDVGKLLIPERILIKPGRLTADEYESVREHARYGRDILATHPGYEEVAQVVGQHHEWWNGGGYPSGISGEAIHPIARAIAILDAYSAMIADRPYHRGITEGAALAELERCRGQQFDPWYVDRFVSWREALLAHEHP